MINNKTDAKKTDVNTVAFIWREQLDTRGYYLFLKAYSFPRTTLRENSSLLATDNAVGQIIIDPSIVFK